jgi:hypothetical protein
LANQINLQPQTLDLALYSGDGVDFRLICTDKAGDPVDVNGAVKAEIRLDRTTPEDPPIVAFTVGTTDAYLGIILLSLTGAQTELLSEHPSAVNGKFTGVWDIQWTPAGLQPRTLCQGKVECVADVTQ